VPQPNTLPRARAQRSASCPCHLCLSDSNNHNKYKQLKQLQNYNLLERRIKHCIIDCAGALAIPTEVRRRFLQSLQANSAVVSQLHYDYNFIPNPSIGRPPVQQYSAANEPELLNTLLQVSDQSPYQQLEEGHCGTFGR
jgi:hypothetical protein